MTSSVVITGDYRGKVVDVTNDCTNPSFEVDLTGWQASYYGPGGAGALKRYTGLPWAIVGSSIIAMEWSAGTADAYTCGFFYQVAWNSNATRWIHAQINSPQRANVSEIRVTYYNSANVQIGFQQGPQTYMAQNTWTILEGLFTAPANTHHANVVFCLSQGVGAMATGSQLFLDQVQMAYGLGFVPYFDGSSLADSAGYTYSWAGTPGLSTSNRNKNDPTTGLTPQLVMPYEVSQTSRNVVHQLIDGPVAAALLPGSLRSGTLRLLVLDSATADYYRASLARASTWTYTDSGNAAETMLFVVSGPVRKVQSSDARRWTLEVPFQEVTP